MSQTRPPEIRALAGARAFPPLILVLFHFCEGHGYRGAKWFDLLAGKGYLWVEFFFMLSGFVLTYVYGARWRELWQPRAYLRFIATRLARLYPLHVAMLFVILFMVISLRALAAHYGYVSIYDLPWHPIVTAKTFVANLFLVQAWNIFPYLSWNGAAWFVSVEFLLCLMFPLYLAIADRGLAAAAFLIVAGALGLTVLAFTPKAALDLTYHNGIFRGMCGFAIGVGLAVLYTRIRARRGEPLADSVHTLFQLTALALLLYGIYDTGWAHRPEDIFTVLPMAPLILALSFDRGLVAAALKTAMPLKLGEWSYAIYLGQTAIEQFLDHIHFHLLPKPADIVLGRPWADWQPVWLWLEPALVVAAAILWGYVLFALVERPAARALRGLMAADRKTAPA